MKRLRDRADARRRLVAGLLRPQADTDDELMITVPFEGVPPAVEVGRALRGLNKAIAQSRQSLPAMRVYALRPEAELVPGQLHIVLDRDGLDREG